MLLRILNNSGRASAAGGGMETEASKSPTTTMFPRRMAHLQHAAQMMTAQGYNGPG
jgi:hypothetical protein